MTNRISLSDLTAVIDRINRETNSPAESYTKQDDGSYKCNVGNYHLSRAYGGYSLHRMSNESGGVSDVFYGGYTTARDLYNRMHAFLAGINNKAA